MLVRMAGFALICSSWAFGCSTDESAGTPDGGTQGSAGSSGASGGSAGSAGASGGSAGASAGATGSNGSAGSGGSSGSSGSTGDGGDTSDGSSGSGGSLGGKDGGGTDAGIDAGVVRCVGEDPVFPKFDAACWDNTWCAIGFHQTDCCGNMIALGMLHPEIERFAVAERICKSQYPGCGCPTGPFRTDTGQTTTEASKVAVECRAGVCTTYVP